MDVFAASLVRSLPDEFDKSGNGNRLDRRLRHHRRSSSPRRTVEPYVFFRRDENLRSELGAVRQPAADDDRRPHRRPAAGRSRLRRRDGACSAARWPTTRSARGPATGSCANRCRARARSSSPPSTTSRPATRTPPTAPAPPSISSIPPATTSWAWPIRWAGATCTTCARASSSRPSRPRRSR